MPDINDVAVARNAARRDAASDVPIARRRRNAREIEKFFDEGIKRVADLRNAYNASKRSYDELLVVVFEGLQMELNSILEEKQTD